MASEALSSEPRSEHHGCSATQRERCPNLRTVDAMSASRAFTLTEILVVIGIIGLLAALAFPVLSAARLKSKETVTLSNLRQIYVQTSLYQSDHGGDGVFGNVYEMGLPPGPQSNGVPMLGILLPPLMHPDAKTIGRQYFPLFSEPEYDAMEPSWSAYAQSEGPNAVLYIDPHFTRSDIPLLQGNFYKRVFYIVRLSGSVQRVERRGQWLSRTFWLTER